MNGMVDHSSRIHADVMISAMHRTVHRYDLRCLYNNKHYVGLICRAAQRLLGIRCGLADLSVVLDHHNIVGCHHVGVKPVAIDRIIGSEGRSSDYDKAFRPLKSHGVQRWMRVAEAKIKGIPLPAIDLIEINDGYYLRDGHNRVSVALALGDCVIDAKVTHYDIAPKVVDWDYGETTTLDSIQSWDPPEAVSETPLWQRPAA